MLSPLVMMVMHLPVSHVSSMSIISIMMIIIIIIVIISIVSIITTFLVYLQLHKQLDDVAERLSSRESQSSFDSPSTQRQTDLEVELLERKVRLFLGRAELIEKRDQPTAQEVQDDVNTIHDKWNLLLKLVDAARRDEAERERLRRDAAEKERLRRDAAEVALACVFVLLKVSSVLLSFYCKSLASFSLIKSQRMSLRLLDHKFVEMLFCCV